MLESLHISNYALIDSIDINFHKGLSIITGETGAGKSILLGALSLLLGNRADLKTIRDNKKKTIIEAVFTSTEALDIQPAEIVGEPDGTIILRREILASSGRSRSFVNDSPVTLPQLALIANKLIDIHSQHKNALISDSAFRLKIIDSSGDHQELITEYSDKFNHFISLRTRYRKLVSSQSKLKEEEDFLRFRLSQLNDFKPQKGEQSELERRYSILRDAENIKKHLETAAEAISMSENSAISKLSIIKDALSKIPKGCFCNNPENDLYGRIENVLIELKDIAQEIEHTFSGIEDSEDELSVVSGRLDKLYELQLQFKADSEDKLADIYDDLNARLASLDTDSDNIHSIEKEMKTAAAELKDAAQKLTEKRIKASENFSHKLTETAMQLGLPNLTFKAQVNKSKLTADGGDYVDFLCGFNKNSDLQPVEKIASGGEISRLMLSLKSVLADKLNIPTLIFDEIDTGVSGEIADKMGEMMMNLSSSLQIITITHLPQVAAKGTEHFKVFKQDTETSTHTAIKRLDKNERNIELAKMLSGSVVNDAAIKNAEALLANNPNTSENHE